MRTTQNLAARAAISLALMVGFYVLALVIILCLIAIPVGVYMVQERVSSRGIKVGIFCLLAAGTIFWAILPRRDKFEKPGVLLRKKEQPELFAEIEEIARLTNQEMPREVYLVDEVNAFVAQRGGFMGFGGKRVMGLGLPLMRVMSKAQMRGVIAHEFGHFHGGDVKLGPLIYKTHRALGRTITTLEETDSFLDRPFKLYGKLFLRITRVISRAQEYAADALSAKVNGREPLISGLSLLEGASFLYPRYMRSEFVPVLQEGKRAPLVAGFGQFMESTRSREISAALTEESLAEANSDPYDTHPPLALRVEALEEAPGGEGRTEEGSAVELLRDLSALEARLLAFTFNDKGILEMPCLEWSAVAEEVWLKSWQEGWAERGSVVEGWVVDELPDHGRELSQLGRKFGPAELPPSEWKDCAIWNLGVGLGLLLHRMGFRLEAAPGESVEFIRGDERVDPHAVVRDLFEGEGGAKAWANSIEKWGIAGEPLYCSVAKDVKGAKDSRETTVSNGDTGEQGSGSEDARDGDRKTESSIPRASSLGTLRRDPVIAHINTKLGPVPRKIGRLDWRLYHKVNLPCWDWKEDGDEIGRILDNWERIHKEGEVRWASLVQANALLFGKNHLDCPGDVVVWCDETVAFDQIFLESVASQLVALKGRSGELQDPGEKRYAQILEEEMVRTYGLPVPESLSQGVDLRIFTLFFQVLQMPEGVLAESSFPVFHLAKPETAAMVPYEYWPQDMQKRWTQIAKMMIEDQKQEQDEDEE